MAERIRCLVCGGEIGNIIFTCTDELTTKEKFPICQCSNCGFKFTLNAPPESEIGPYYLSEDYISHTDSKRSITERLYHTARALMLRKKLNLVRRFAGKNEGSILDIGCGTGYFPAFMKKHGWQASGIEVSTLAREYAISKFSLQVISPEQTEMLNPASFDCITLWHVMEHLYEPQSWFIKINTLLKDDGICVIALPNADSADAEWFKGNWAAYDVPRHLWHFSPSVFSKLASANGFDLIKTRSLPFDVFYISILSFKNKGASFSFLRGILTGCMLTLCNFFNKEKGSSIVYVLKKARS